MTKISISRIPGEYWWGGVINEGSVMPFGQAAHTRNLRMTDDNQATPLLLSSKGRYIWSEDPFAFRIDENGLSVFDSAGEVTIEEGHHSLQGAYRHAASTHFPPSGLLPDAFAFTAPQYCTWVEMFYAPTQDKIIRYAEAILANGLPPGILIIDDNWMKDYGMWDFDKHRFPDPRVMVDTLHGMGFKVMLWMCPYISPDCTIFKELRGSDLLMKGEDGTPVLRHWWNGYSAVVDYTREEGAAWFRQQMDRLTADYGVDGFKLDAGEPILPGAPDTTQPIAWSRPLRLLEDCEAYASLGVGYPLVELRMCWKLGGQALIQRQRDKTHTWDARGLGGLIPNAIAQGLLGYAFNCPDMIGGGMDGDINSPDFRFDSELFVRYAQCAALFPVMQFSMAPWRVLRGEELTWCLDAVRLRSELGPELLALARQAAADGLPILRSLEFEYPGCGYELVQDQFLLGSNLLVAPVIVKGQTSRCVVFPEGRWQGDDGSVVIGPTELEVEAPLSRLPWYRSIQ
ncbi:glycoside hydrolase family 31 protein [Paenibacillus dokdonensis]|uniref:Glycoside hydrolase family 31 protein n=1 Tax=Paenibacillus dokdonensis TaxID=2567944 RepID=A0ABU6GQV1_9BACL|nr:glycoside hydrolase family 31 protein [Paenibacillus dokdonensis]MEC0241754.1 glycoside hydrolase family 31 protein [Paenibacillus dokdonensis]